VKRSGWKCSKCGGGINPGELYTAIGRQTEREVEPKVVEVLKTDPWDAYHPACAPKAN
jgi:hypothetical protein